MSEPQITGYTDLVAIGRGGFAVVYRARREALDQDVAVKVLSLPDLTERDLDRFQRECRAAGNLAWHPHVVAVYDSGTTAAGQPYLAMEYLDGGTLADRLTTDGPLPWQDVVDLGIQVAGALGAAHAAGTLHRDLKPENILVGHFGEALLADFGIAAVEGSTRTATGHAAFTVTHVAPEILKGQRPDERTDLYGLASTLFTLLTGHTPFQGGDPDEPVATVITRVLTEPAPHLDTIPAPLADLLDRALDKDPDARPQNVEAFGEALQAIQRANTLPVTDLRLTRTRRPAADKPDGTATAEPGTTGDDPNATITLTPTPPPDTEAADADEPAPADDDLNATITLDRTFDTPPDDSPDPTEPPHPTEPPPPDRTAPEPASARSKTPLLVGLGVLAVLALAAGAFLVLGGGDDNASPSTSSTTSTTAPGTANTVTDTLAIATAVREDVDALAATTDALWAVNDGEGTVTRVDPTTLESAAIVDVPAGIAALGGSSSSSGDFFDGIAAAGDDVWVDSTEVALRIDPSSNEVVLRGTQNQAPNAQAITATEQAAWTAADGVGFDTVTRFDRATGEGTELQLDDRGMAMSDIAATTSAVWVTDSSGGRLLRIDPAAVSLSETISVGGVPVAVAAADGAVWVADAEGDDLIRVDADTDEVVETIQLPARPVDVAATQRAAWVTLDSGQVVRVDSSSNELVATIDVADPRSVAATDRDVWVASGSSQVVRIDPG